MGKPTVANTTPKPKTEAPPSWKDGEYDCKASPEDLALTLSLGLYHQRMSNLANDAAQKLMAAADFVQAISHMQEDGGEASLETPWVLRSLIHDARRQYELSRRQVAPDAFQVNVTATGGAR